MSWIAVTIGVAAGASGGAIYANNKKGKPVKDEDKWKYILGGAGLGAAGGAGASALAGGGAAAPIGATGGAGGMSGGTQVATAMGNPVTYGQTAQGAGGIFMGTTGAGAPMWAGTAPGLGSGSYAGSSTPLANNPAKKPNSGMKDMIKQKMMEQLVNGMRQGSNENKSQETPPMEIPTIENPSLPPPAAPLPFNYLNRANPYMFR